MKLKKNKTFESQLFHAMESAGLIFPVSDQQVNDFEQRFGETKIPMPFEFQTPNLTTDSVKKREPLMKMAAFSKKNKFGKDFRKN